MSTLLSSLWSLEGLLFVASSLTILCLANNKRKSKSRICYCNNPTIQSVNRLPSHATLACFHNESDARVNITQLNQSSYVKYLNGVWNFQLFDNVESALHWIGQNLFDSNFISRESEVDMQSRHPKVTITVPGNWQMQVVGDSPIYTNVKYIIPIHAEANPLTKLTQKVISPVSIPLYNPTGFYQYKFDIPQQWSNRHIRVHFDGVDNAFYLWCNSNFIGFSKDSRLPCEFDITNFVAFKQLDDDKDCTVPDAADTSKSNTFEVVVVRYSDGYYLEDQDMFNLSGIFRDVYIYSLPNQVFISDYNYFTNIDHNTQVGILNIDINVTWDKDHILSLFGSVGNMVFSDIDRSHCLFHDIALYNHPNYSSYVKQLETDWIVESRLYEEGNLSIL